MRRTATVSAVALIVLAAWTASANAQVVGVQIVRPYTPVYVQPTMTPAYYVAPGYVVPSRVPMIAPSYAATIPVMPQAATVISYYAPPAPVYVAPAPGIYTTRTVETRGILRPRVVITDTYYSPR